MEIFDPKYLTLPEQVLENKEDIEEVKQTLENEIPELKSAVEANTSGLQSATTSISSLESRVTSISGRVTTIETEEIPDLQQNISDNTQAVKELNNRVTALEESGGGGSGGSGNVGFKTKQYTSFTEFLTDLSGGVFQNIYFIKFNSCTLSIGYTQLNFNFGSEEGMTGSSRSSNQNTTITLTGKIVPVVYSSDDKSLGFTINSIQNIQSFYIHTQYSNFYYEQFGCSATLFASRYGTVSTPTTFNLTVYYDD